MLVKATTMGDLAVKGDIKAFVDGDIKFTSKVFRIYTKVISTGLEAFFLLYCKSTEEFVWVSSDKCKLLSDDLV